jgi:dihydrofolate reductase
MRVFIIAAVTADGFIGRDSRHLADWTSPEDKKLFVELTKEAGVMVMGSNTFATIGRALPDRRNLVYSRQQIDQPGIEVVTEPPEELLRRLEREGHDSVAICGGQTIYDMFLQAGLVNELYLTIEPILFGTGVPLMHSAISAQLQLKEVKKLNDNTVMVHYEVVT